MNNVTLSEEQRKIVEHSGSPMRILAGPGTGKTFCIIEKAKKLINKDHISYKNICIITLTNSAKNEIRKRLEESGIKSNELPYVNTLHGLGMGILIKNISCAGLKIGFKPISNLIQKIIVKDVSEDLKCKKIILSFKERKKYLNIIMQIKSLAGVLYHIQKNIDQKKCLKEFQRSYSDNLEFYNCIDFPEEIGRAIELINSNFEIKSKIHERTKYLLVDEFQDLSPLEQKFVYQICGDSSNLSIFGDDDQSIYESFRFASPDGIINFQSIYPNTIDFPISICRRCSQKIIEKAMLCIKNNNKRIIKNDLIPFNKTRSGFFFIFQKRSKKEEIEWISNKILELIRNGFQYKDLLILFPDGKIAKDYIEKMEDVKIPLKIQLKIDHTFETECCTQLLATLRWVVDRNNNLNMRQCLDYANQIGIETIRQIRLLAISLNCNLWMIIENINKNIDAFSSMRQRKKVVEFHLYLKDLFNYKNFNEIVYKFFNYVPLSKSDNGCQKVLAFLNEYEKTKIITLKDVLDEMDQKLLESENKDEIDEQNEVRVMTMHSSKGCESPIVFIPAMEDDIMPGIDLENIEEKRRLFYVSLTRAKYGVFITWTKQRTGQEIHMQGRKMLNKQRSVFLDEIDKK